MNAQEAGSLVDVIIFHVSNMLGFAVIRMVIASILMNRIVNIG